MGAQIWRRSRFLISEILAELSDAEGGVSLPVVMDLGLSFTKDDGRPRWSERTVRNTIADLEGFGAVSVTGPVHDRRVKVTTLGLAWMAQRVLPAPMEMNELEGAVEDLAEWFA